MKNFDDFILALTDGNFNPIEDLFKRLDIKGIAADVGFQKGGPNSIDRVACLQKLTELAAQGKTVYAEELENGPESLPASARTLYKISSDPDVNWLQMQVKVGARAIKEVWKIRPDSPKGHLVVDDTVCEYPLTEQTREGLSRVYDHNKDDYVNGFLALQVGWSVGRVYIPIALIPIASGDDKNLLIPVKRAEEGSAAKETNELARSPKPEVLLKVIDMLREEGVEIPALEGDSWYTNQKLAIELSDRHTSLIGRLKVNNTGYFCDLNGSGEFRKWTLNQMLEKNKDKIDWDSESGILLEMEIRIRDYDVVKPERGAAEWNLKHDLKGKIVFCRGCSSKLPKERNWIAILTTEKEDRDGAEVVEDYFDRWDVELFFRDGKQILLLVKGTQKHTLTGLFGHYTFLMMAYIAAMLMYIEENLPTVTCALHRLAKNQDSLDAKRGAAQFAWSVYQKITVYLGDQAEAIIADCLDSLPGWLRAALGFKDGEGFLGG